MRDDFLDRIQSSLGDAYAIERELGGGGMSRVLVAQERRFRRRVVIKLLTDEQARGLSAERFEREIRVAAALQQANIVPVLDAGEASGLPYYTMPFVDGESLRARLDAGAPLPLNDVLRILGDVARALQYAHAQGVVHRDIKPDNVLISGGTAVVTDFGIAKAISASRTGGAGGATLTQVGTSIGTPAYMAPEQVAGDPEVDHRADLYAYGCMAYELLAGRAPFHGRTAQRMLAAHVSEAPVPVRELRPDLPASLAALVMRCLAKDAADRPQSAAEVIAALNVVSGGWETSTPPARAARGRRVAIVAAALLLVAVLVAWLALTRSAPSATLDRNLIAVAPFRVSGDPSLAYLREGMLDLLAAKLTGEGGPRAGDPRTLLAAWRRRAGDAGGDLTEADAVTLARELGAGHLLLGAVVGTPQRVSLRASLLDVPSGRVRTTADVEGATDSLGALVDRLAADLLARSAGEAERLAGTIATTSLPVLRLYLDGVADVRRGRYPEAQQSFARALALDSTFVHAAFGLVTNNGNHPIDDSAAWAILEREEHRLNERDRAQVEVRRRFLRGDSYASQLEAGRRLVALAPDRAIGWDEVGGLLALFGGLFDVEDPQESARAAFTRALELEPDYTSPLRGLVEVAADLRDTAALRVLWPRYQRLASGSLELETVRWTVAQALGDSATLAALRARFPTLPPRDLLRIVERMMVSGRGLEDAPAALRALEASAVDDYDIERGSLAASSFLRNAGREEAVPARFRRSPSPPAVEDVESVLDALFWDGDGARARDAVTRVEAVARGGGAELPSHLRPWAACVPAIWHLMRGDTTAAAPSLQRTRGFLAAAAAGRRDAGFPACALGAEALLEQARGRTANRVALDRLDSLLIQGFEGVQHGNLIAARIHEARGDRRAALAAVRRRANHGRDGPIVLTTMLREEGRLAALVGDRAGAIRAYRHFLALRPDPVPRLRADRDRVRAELARLEAAGN